MAHPEHDHNSKRKRDTDDSGQQSHDRIPQPPPPQSGNGAHINYLAKSQEKLQLIQGDPEVFSDVLGLISDYEGVLSRQESLAANLGAKLTGPRLVKAMEGLFDGPITISQRDPYNPSPVTWLDIIQFAKANPAEFVLTPSDQGRCCSFYLKGNQVEITEDDWRLIMSEALDRFNLAQPLDEDENSELATLEILEQRLHILIKKADEVARKARQLNYHLSGRKSAISSRRTSMKSPPTHHAGFQPVNHQQQTQLPRSGSTYNLHDDLLQQFISTPASHLPSRSARVAHNSVSLPTTPMIQQGTSGSNTAKPSIQPLHISGRPSPASAPETQQNPRPPRPDDPSAAHRPLITARIEKLAKGDSIYPPCDRCRRLRVSCIKHLTACQGCTKKHAKCSWKSVTDEEVVWLKSEVGTGSGSGSGNGDVDGEVDDGGSRSGGAYTPDPQSASSTSMVETRTFAPIITSHSTGNGNGGTGSGSMGNGQSKEIQTKEFGLREHHPVDHYRLSHMATVALNSDHEQSQQQQQQQQQQQDVILNSGITPRD